MITINEIKSWLDKFVADGGKVDSLGQQDKLYRQIKDADIFVNGKRLTTAEKFELAGHPRAKKLTPIEKCKKYVEDFFAAGGKLEDIKKGTEIYALIKNTYVRLPDGSRATVEQKFEMMELKRRPRRIVSIDEIKQRLKEFIDAGGNVDDLGVDDELYKLVKGIDNKHTLEEKFAMCGVVRKPKKVYSVTDELIKKVKAYLEAGGTFHIPRKQLPFYEDLHASKRAYLRKTGQHISSKEMLESLGFKGYSDIYFNYIKIFELASYKDSHGYVDSYRSNPVFDATIDRYAEDLGMPIALVVELVGDQRLERSCLQTDTLSYISKQLQDYKRDYGSFNNISRTDPQLYNRLCRLKKVVKTDDGKPVSTRELVELLGSYDSTAVFSDSTYIRELNYEEDIVPLVTHARETGGTISARDIPASIYRTILDYAARNATTISDFFDDFGVEYVDARRNGIFSKLYVDSFPYIHEMRAERDELSASLQVQESSLTKEEIFEKYIEICQKVYAKYKPLIESFGLNENFDSSKLKGLPVNE